MLKILHKSFPAAFRVSPDSWAESEEDEEAVALCETGQEGEDAVDGQCVEQTLSSAQFISQTAPQDSADHHPHVHY